MRILYALLSIGVGTALLFIGYKFARVLIPLMGFLVGMSLGGAVMADMNSTPFLGTFVGIVVGVLAGLVLAVLAYAYYYAAVVILAAGLGYWIGSGFILLFGFSPGFLSAVVGLVLGALAGVFAVMSNAPKYFLMFLTSVVGAVAAVGGIMLLFNVIPLGVYSYTTARLAIANSFFWGLLAVLAFGVGLASQIMTTESSFEVEQWGMDEPTGHDLPTSTTHATGAR